MDDKQTSVIALEEESMKREKRKSAM